MSVWMVLLLAVCGGLVLGGVLVVVLRRVLRKQRVESGWEDWMRVATTLPWRDRLALARSTATGRPVKQDRLAALAAQRSEAAQRYIAVASWPTVWLWRLIGVVWLGKAVVQATENDWLFAGVYALLVIGAFCMPFFLRMDRRRAARSATANTRRNNKD